VYVVSATSQPALAEVVDRAHRFRLPVLVDAAGELPPRENLKAIAATGADLIAFSGGKAIRGPQSTGLLCGRRDLIAAAAVQMLDMDDHFDLWDPPIEFIDKTQLGGIPRHGIGRNAKVSKEEIVAFLTALDLFASTAYASDLAAFRSQLETIAGKLRDLDVSCKILDRGDGESLPILEIALDGARLGRTALEVCRSLRRGSPPVYVGHGRLSQGILVVNPLCLNAERAQTLARRLLEELERGR
jgi:L-seryl-tRNA(Ser) seleniumtransferase